MSDGPKIVTLDIETTPMGAWVFDIWGQNISVPQFRERTRVMGLGWKWADERNTNTSFEWDASHEEMVNVAWMVLDEADVVVHFNGKRFDIPHLNREFDKYGLKEPSPYAQIDLLAVAKAKMKFVSNKLQNIALELGIGQKMDHEGLDLWLKCMAGDEAARKRMIRYCKRDVVLEDALLKRWAPHTKGPGFSLYTLDPERDRCANVLCGSEKIHYRGTYKTNLSTYPKFQCQKCGRWGRGKHAVARVDARGVA